jgi:hypothetical protein
MAMPSHAGGRPRPRAACRMGTDHGHSCSGRRRAPAGRHIVWVWSSPALPRARRCATSSHTGAAATRLDVALLFRIEGGGGPGREVRYSLLPACQMRGVPGRRSSVHLLAFAGYRLWWRGRKALHADSWPCDPYFGVGVYPLWNVRTSKSPRLSVLAGLRPAVVKSWLACALSFAQRNASAAHPGGCPTERAGANLLHVIGVEVQDDVLPQFVVC